MEINIFSRIFFQFALHLVLKVEGVEYIRQDTGTTRARISIMKSAPNNAESDAVHPDAEAWLVGDAQDNVQHDLALTSESTVLGRSGFVCEPGKGHEADQTLSVMHRQRRPAFSKNTVAVPLLRSVSMCIRLAGKFYDVDMSRRSLFLRVLLVTIVLCARRSFLPAQRASQQRLVAS